MTYFCKNCTKTVTNVDKNKVPVNRLAYNITKLWTNILYFCSNNCSKEYQTNETTVCKS